MIELQSLIETSDEIMEQIVLSEHPNANIYKDTEEGLRVKKRYGDLRQRVFMILDNNLTGGKYGIQEPSTAQKGMASAKA